MKRIALSLLICLALFNSCKKDSTAANKASITGKWYWVEQTYDSYTDDKLTGHNDYTTTLDPKSYFEFDADGTFVENPQDHDTNYIYGQYTINGNALNITRQNDPTPLNYTIKTLTAQKLVIHLTTGQAPYRGEIEYTMKR